MRKPFVHLSVDDVLLSLAPPAPEHTMLACLSEYNRVYNAKFTLYCYSFQDNFLISEIKTDYFQKARKWLALGYHAKTNEPFASDHGYQAGFELTQRTFRALKATRANVLRLHYWDATSEQRAFLSKHGVKRILNREDSIKCENLSEINAESLRIGREEIFFFTHEWCFEQEREKLEAAIRLYCDAGYEFII